jgi:hypothetical protein
VPFVVIALRYFKAAPLASVIGVVFGAAFIGFEVTHRSLDFFFVGEQWAREFANVATTADRDLILQRFATWNGIAHAWFFPLMLSFLLASCSFAVATWTDRNRGGWYYLGPVAYATNALRLLGRILSDFLGQHWLDGLNGQLYFPIISCINALLLLWFLVLARERPEPVSVRARESAVAD